MKILVAGASGFLGGHLVGRLLREGHDVRAVSRRPVRRWSQRHTGAECAQADLGDREACARATRGMDAVCHLAAMIGGIGYLESHHADCTTSVVASSNLLEAAVRNGCERFLFTSSACVYPESDAAVIREADVTPFDPRGGYGWQKLFTEKMCEFYAAQYGLGTRVARLATIYGPHSPIGEAEKAPIAICRKVIQAIQRGSDEIEIWGDGQQTRSFLYVDDCMDALIALLRSDYPGAVNIGSTERVTVNELVSIVEAEAGVKLRRVYQADMPQGVRHRMSDVTLAREQLGWQEATPLREGIRKTFQWVRSELSEPALA